MKLIQTTQYSRRHFGALAFASAAAASIFPARAASSDADAASSPVIAPAGVFQAKFADYTITSILDGMIPMERQLFSGPESKIDKVLEATGQTGKIIPGPISAFLLESKSRKILIDSGMGSLDILGPNLGNVGAGLAAVGVKPSQIDQVILTHAHPDHIGGMLTSDGKKKYPNAEVVIAAKEASFWMDAAMMAKAPDSAKGMFQLAQKVLSTYGNQVTQVAAGKEVAPGIQLDLLPGHTPGHSILTIDGGSQEIKMIADTLHNAELHTILPEIGFAFDSDPKLAAASRTKIFDQLSTDKSLILGSHVHFPCFGRILKDHGAYRYSAASV